MALDRYLDGADELEAKLSELGHRATGHIVRNAAEKGAEPIVEEAKRLAPVDTGKLKESIDAEIHRVQQGRTQINISFAKDAWYGRLLELGTEKMPAKPFLRPAIDNKADEARDIVADELAKALEDVIL